MAASRSVVAPSLLLALFEWRALAETALMPIAYQCTPRLPKGQGAPVLIIPGFMGGDESTYFLQRWLRNLGYVPYGWEQGVNLGLRDKLQRGLARRLQKIQAEHEQPVRLIGWSLGGIQARALAHEAPAWVNNVITMGSPFRMPGKRNVRGPTARMYRRINGNELEALLDPNAAWQNPPPVPCTAVYSRSDGIANWDLCVDKLDKGQAENIGVVTSHLGMSSNPMVLLLLADRLSKNKEQWRYFKASGVQKLLYQCERAEALRDA